ncbi:sugar transferase [Hydrococcus rivularis]|uniref:sugar transferase n=1 Tax=Hydrococcus rivularis TaxID=1616834 RepID=UPI0009F8EF01|nr:sugar transferase [Hydrococcus rivularis]
MTYSALNNDCYLINCDCPPDSATIGDRACLIQLPERFTLPEASLLEKKFQSIIHANSTPKKIILDFAQTTWIDSSGLLCLKQLVRVASTVGVDIVSWSFSSQIKTLLSRSGCDRLFESESETEAIWQQENSQNLAIHPSVNSRIKRLFDILGALAGLAITAVIFIPIAIAIQLDNPGPIFYSQIRCGYMGKPFRIWKFRSMVVNADRLQAQVENQTNSGFFFKNKNDPRITKVGRFLRKTSLDEFPQFWNVLKGEMSLVGTRPPTIEEVYKYEISYGQRLNVKPGLTGEWQVNGRSKIVDFEEVVRLDLKYQRNWSFLYDFKLILKTIIVIFSKESGAC